MPTVRAIVADALIEIGVMEPGDTLSAQQGALGLTRFQHQLDAWAADRLTLAVQTRTTVTLLPGTGTITLGLVGADVTMARPVFINGVNYIIPGSAPEVEVPIGLMDEDAYRSLSIKALPSALPLLAFYQTSMSTTLGSLFIWPQLTQSVDIAIYSPQAVGIPLALTDTVIGPSGYQEAFLYGLALRLCGPFGVAPPPTLPEMFRQAMATMKRPNVAPGMLGVDPALTLGPRAAYNILSDSGGRR